MIRVNQIEVTRDENHGADEPSIHSPAEGKIFREAVEKAWPGARITWAFSWQALQDERENYSGLRELVISYHKKFGDEITFIPGGYFANMYNTREQVNRDLHEGLQMVSEMVGDGYRPKSVIAGFLSAENLRYLAEEENIHVCQGKDDYIDCVNLDGWTVDFLCARIPGSKMVHGVKHRSRQGVGPIETVIDMGTELGTKSMLATTAAHFDDGFEKNGFAWVTCGWELGLVEARKIYGYDGRNGMEGLHVWLTETRKRWPDAKFITQGEFGLLWREHFKDNEKLDYRFVQRGCGVHGSVADTEIRWFMNKDFRLALERNLDDGNPEKVIDFTRYDLPASEPADFTPGKRSRNWSLMNRLNQKGTRPQDKPIPLDQLDEGDQTSIKQRYPELFGDEPTE